MRRRFGWLAGLSTAWWAASGVVAAARYHRWRAKSGIPVTWSRALRSELSSALMWVPPTMLSLWLAGRFPLGRSSRQAITAHAGGLAGTILGRAALVMTFNRIGRWHETVPPARELLVTSTLNNLFEYAMITGVAHAFHYAREHRAREAQLAHARLVALRGQVRPHFLFNALNTIAASVRDRPEEADRMLVQLGLLLRRSLDTDDASEVPLRTELALVRAYLEIEQARFADRLRVGWAIGRDLLDAAVPPLVLQPLVENAVRHGLSPRPAGGRVAVTARRIGGRLRLRVIDDGVGMPQGQRLGLGLRNVQSRLRMLYGAQGALTVRPGGGGRGTAVEIVLPFQRLPFRELDEDDLPGDRSTGGQSPEAPWTPSDR